MQREQNIPACDVEHLQRAFGNRELLVRTIREPSDPEQVQQTFSKGNEMKAFKRIFAVIVAASCVAVLATPVTAGAEESGSDAAFNQMIGEMAGRDTGSGWMDYYVTRLNQDIAASEVTQPYGAAGPNGPLDGFNGYVSGFIQPDTGSAWFNTYIDMINAEIQQKQQ